eukprot:3032473-Lingulodinium_polyedra.AAC.1
MPVASRPATRTRKPSQQPRPAPTATTRSGRKPPTPTPGGSNFQSEGAAKTRNTAGWPVNCWQFT